MQRVPVHTVLGELHGRDTISLDKLHYESGRDALRMEGSIMQSRTVDEVQEIYALRYALTFTGVLSCHSIEPDCPQAHEKSSFEEEVATNWVQLHDVAVAAGVHRHFFIQTTDGVVCVVAQSFSMELLGERGNP